MRARRPLVIGAPDHQNVLMNKFEVGDVVQLKSGGPLMTVVGVHESRDVKCMWFTGGQAEAAREDSFPVDALRKVQK